MITRTAWKWEVKAEYNCYFSFLVIYCHINPRQIGQFRCQFPYNQVSKICASKEVEFFAWEDSSRKKSKMIIWKKRKKINIIKYSLYQKDEAMQAILTMWKTCYKLLIQMETVQRKKTNWKLDVDPLSIFLKLLEDRRETAGHPKRRKTNCIILTLKWWRFPHHNPFATVFHRKIKSSFIWQ